MKYKASKPGAHILRLPLCTQSSKINLPAPPTKSLLLTQVIVTPTIIFAILKLIYYFQGQKLISSNAVLSVVLQCSGKIFLTRKKPHDHSLNLKAKLVFAFCCNALIFKFVCVIINSLKLIAHLIILQHSHCVFLKFLPDLYITF